MSVLRTLRRIIQKINLGRTLKKRGVKFIELVRQGEIYEDQYALSDEVMDTSFQIDESAWNIPEENACIVMGFDWESYRHYAKVEYLPGKPGKPNGLILNVTTLSEVAVKDLLKGVGERYMPAWTHSRYLT